MTFCWKRKRSFFSKSHKRARLDERGPRMETEKRKIIVQEIDYWRYNRLLPEQYCDFLQNLYQEGEGNPDKRIFGLSASSIKAAKPWPWILMISLAGIIFYCVFYFTSFPFLMQMALAAGAVLGFYTVGVKQRRRRPTLSFCCLWAAALILPGAGLYFILHQQGSPEAAVILLVVCAVYWMATGIASRFASFHLCGWLLVLMIYGWFLNRTGTEVNLTTLELYFMPVGTILVWLGILLQSRRTATAWVLGAAGCILLMCPEIYGLGFTGIADSVLQIALAAKLLGGMLLLYSTRKKWTEWVA